MGTDRRDGQADRLARSNGGLPCRTRDALGMPLQRHVSTSARRGKVQASVQKQWKNTTISSIVSHHAIPAGRTLRRPAARTPAGRRSRLLLPRHSRRRHRQSRQRRSLRDTKRLQDKFTTIISYSISSQLDAQLCNGQHSIGAIAGAFGGMSCEGLLSQSSAVRTAEAGGAAGTEGVAPVDDLRDRRRRGVHRVRLPRDRDPHRVRALVDLDVHLGTRHTHLDPDKDPTQNRLRNRTDVKL